MSACKHYLLCSVSHLRARIEFFYLSMRERVRLRATPRLAASPRCTHLEQSTIGLELGGTVSAHFEPKQQQKQP